MTDATHTPADPAPDAAGDANEQRVVAASRVIPVAASAIFELIADPSQQPRWDGNDNLGSADAGQRVRAIGDVFTMRLTRDGMVRENHVVEFEEGRVIAWKPAEVGGEPIGHLWRWQLEPVDGGTRVTHIYDWTDLHDPARLVRARATTSNRLDRSIARLAVVAQAEATGAGGGGGAVADEG